MAAQKGKGPGKAVTDTSASLEKEGARLLKVVQNKMAERDRLLQQEVSQNYALVCILWLIRFRLPKKLLVPPRLPKFCAHEP